MGLLNRRHPGRRMEVTAGADALVIHDVVAQAMCGGMDMNDVGNSSGMWESGSLIDINGVGAQKYSDGIGDNNGTEAKASINHIIGVGAQKHSEGVRDNNGTEGSASLSDVEGVARTTATTIAATTTARVQELASPHRSIGRHAPEARQALCHYEAPSRLRVGAGALAIVEAAQHLQGEGLRQQGWIRPASRWTAEEPRGLRDATGTHG